MRVKLQNIRLFTSQSPGKPGLTLCQLTALFQVGPIFIGVVTANKSIIICGKNPQTLLQYTVISFFFSTKQFFGGKRESRHPSNAFFLQRTIFPPDCM